MAGKGWEMLEMARNGWNGWKWLERARNGLNGSKRLDMAGNDWKVLEMAGMADSAENV